MQPTKTLWHELSNFHYKLFSSDFHYNYISCICITWVREKDRNKNVFNHLFQCNAMVNAQKLYIITCSYIRGLHIYILRKIKLENLVYNRIALWLKIYTHFIHYFFCTHFTSKKFFIITTTTTTTTNSMYILSDASDVSSTSKTY